MNLKKILKGVDSYLTNLKKILKELDFWKLFLKVHFLNNSRENLRLIKLKCRKNVYNKTSCISFQPANAVKGLV